MRLNVIHLLHLFIHEKQILDILIENRNKAVILI